MLYTLMDKPLSLHSQLVYYGVQEYGKYKAWGWNFDFLLLSLGLKLLIPTYTKVLIVG